MTMFRLCSCGKRINAALNMCETCRDKHMNRHKIYDKYSRDKESTSFYKNNDWKRVRVQALARDHGLCLHCLSKKLLVKADMVDHIIPIKVNWRLRLSLDNLQSLCNPCHNTKTAADKRKYFR